MENGELALRVLYKIHWIQKHGRGDRPALREENILVVNKKRALKQKGLYDTSKDQSAIC